jgi:hypothetical protein
MLFWGAMIGLFLGLIAGFSKPVEPMTPHGTEHTVIEQPIAPVLQAPPAYQPPIDSDRPTYQAPTTMVPTPEPNPGAFTIA